MRIASLVLGALAVLAACSCGSAARQICDETTKAICERVFACYDNQERQAGAFADVYGTDQQGCLDVVGTPKCRDVTDTRPCGGNTRQKYDADQAQACLEAIRAQTCAQLRDPGQRPAHCDQACQ